MLKASKHEANLKIRHPWNFVFPKDPSKTMTLIGHMWKHSNVWSRVILMDREAYLNFFSHENSHAFLQLQNLVVSIARGIHPIPFRTRKLSLSAPMIAETQK